MILTSYFRLVSQQKSYFMVDSCDREAPEIACWVDGATAFVVKDTATLEAAFLPRYFKHSNFQSFTRQLNTYGFRKDSRLKGFSQTDVVFRHEKFQQGRADLLEQVQRLNKKSKVNKGRLPRGRTTGYKPSVAKKAGHTKGMRKVSRKVSVVGGDDLEEADLHGSNGVIFPGISFSQADPISLDGDMSATPPLNVVSQDVESSRKTQLQNLNQKLKVATQDYVNQLRIVREMKQEGFAEEEIEAAMQWRDAARANVDRLRTDLSDSLGVVTGALAYS